MQDRFLSLLGLAARAGKISSGEFAVEKSIKDGKAYLVVISNDCSDNTRKHFTDMCNYRDVPICFYGERKSIGKCIGKEDRVSVAVLDEGFSNGLKSILQEV